MSPGIAGKSFGKGKFNGDPLARKNVLYNCADNIEELVLTGKNYFDNVVISTWESEDTQRLEYALKNAPVSILKVKDPGERRGKSKKGKKRGDHFPNNKIRQFVGLLEGLRNLNAQGVEYSVKIRTDQGINLELLYEEIINNVVEGTFKSGFMFPYFLSNVPWAIPDFFIAGETPKLLTLCEFMIDKLEFHWNVHRDLFFKAAMVTRPKEAIGLLTLWSRENDVVSNREKVLIESVLGSWPTGSLELFSSIFWRGEKISFNSENLIFRPRLSDTVQNFNFTTTVSYPIITDRFIREISGVSKPKNTYLQIKLKFFMVIRKLVKTLKKNSISW